jgi:hypothetical protein
LKGHDPAKDHETQTGEQHYYLEPAAGNEFVDSWNESQNYAGNHPDQKAKQVGAKVSMLAAGTQHRQQA